MKRKVLDVRGKKTVEQKAIHDDQLLPPAPRLNHALPRTGQKIVPDRWLEMEISTIVICSIYMDYRCSIRLASAFGWKSCTRKSHSRRARKCGRGEVCARGAWRWLPSYQKLLLQMNNNGGRGFFFLIFGTDFYSPEPEIKRAIANAQCRAE